MNNQSLTVAIEVSHSPLHVFNCIQHVTQWWSKDFEGNSTMLNNEFIIHHPGQHYSRQKLIEVVPGKKMVWLVTESKLDWLKNNKEEWTNTKMVFELSNEGDTTRLHFTHEGLTRGKECYTMCEQGWNMIIKDWLLHYINTGSASNKMSEAAEIRNNLLKGNA